MQFVCGEWVDSRIRHSTNHTRRRVTVGWGESGPLRSDYWRVARVEVKSKNRAHHSKPESYPGRVPVHLLAIDPECAIIRKIGKDFIVVRGRGNLAFLAGKCERMGV